MRCYRLTAIYIPTAVSEIGSAAFESRDSLTIYGEEGSYAQTYAAENDIPFSTDPMPQG